MEQMDLQQLVNRYKPMTCILSVEKTPQGGCGTIRIVACNPAYRDSIENPAHISSSSMLSNKFVPGSEYTRYIPKDLTFESLCFSAAILGKPVHTYSRPERYPFWLNVFIIPLESDEEDIGYCSYSLELNPVADTKLLADMSAETMSDVLQTCIKLRGTGDFKDIIMEVVGDIRRICDSDHCCVLLTDSAARRCTVLGESLKEGTDLLPMECYLDDSFFDITQTWKDTIAGSTCFIAKDHEDMLVLRERNPVWYSSLSNAGVQSIVMFPLQYGGETLGYLWAINFDVENHLKISRTLEISTYFMASEIANHLLVEKLRTMSSVDLLTGVRNRNAMNIRIDKILSVDGTKQPCGVILTDINGLKYINDHFGHNAGDKLIVSAAEKLKRLCGGMEIFRAGGDEFMIIASDITQQQFDELVDKLREQDEDVSFAVGGCYDAGGLDIHKAMHIADERMYIDKDRYYQSCSDRKR